MDWPSLSLIPNDVPNIHYQDQCSVGAVTGTLATKSSGVWPLVNLAEYIPFRLSRTMLVVNAFIHNGATVAGSFDIGIFSQNFIKLVATGSTAQAGVNVIQTTAVTPTLIGPGLFYIGLSMSDETATAWCAAGNLNRNKILGLATQENAYPLPSTATFATISTANIYSFGFTCRSFV